MDELVQLKDVKLETNKTETDNPALNDSKLEKKVTFARLLNKVSAEMMSSGSEDIELGNVPKIKSFARPFSTPPSPNSSDIVTPPATMSSSISDLRHISKLPTNKSSNKPTSADSILAMFRNFSAINGNDAPSMGDDEMSTTSFSSAPSECSPISIEVPVLDALSVHKGNNFLHPPTILLEIPNTINKCLSPIRELPTPLPSPALTPVMRRNQMLSMERVPSLSVNCEETIEDNANLHKIIPPVLTIQSPSPTHSMPPGSPPPRRSSVCHTIQTKKMLKDFEKPTSLDLPCVPPTITITCNADDDCKTTSSSHLGENSSRMTYLSPFSMNANNAASESNLSSSGYSSMASPGPSSRCSSTNPLYKTNHGQRRDSETLSDDPLLDEEGCTTGSDRAEDKSNKPKELDLPLITLQLPSIVIQCDTPGCDDKHFSPMSSRSESPLSDKTIGRFSAQFYCTNKDLHPFTDSDGLYDFPSSDRVNLSKKSGRKREKKLLRSCKTQPGSITVGLSADHDKKDRKLRRSKTITPVTVHSLLDIPNSNREYKTSPKRKSFRSHVFSSSSSSSDSMTSSMELNTDVADWKSTKSLKDYTYKESHKIYSNYTPKSKSNKTSRLRAVSNQIRFLTRLEQNLDKRERTASSDSGEESPKATSPLLQIKGPRVEIRKKQMQFGDISI